MGYKQRIIAFIDILGFKESVEKSNNNPNEFSRITKTLTDFHDIFIRSNKKHNKTDDKILNFDTQITQVSDSLIISRSSEGRGAIYKTLLDCSFAIHILIENGYLCRGIIEIGNLHHTDKLIFGDGFINAFTQESKEFRPIVRFNKKIIDNARLYPFPANETFVDWEVEFIKKNCKEINPETYYLDYFTDYDSRVGGGEGSAFAHYSKLREIILDGLTNKDPEVCKKYKWAAEQFNLTAQNFELNSINFLSY